MLLNKKTINVVLIALFCGVLLWYFSVIVAYLLISIVLAAILSSPTNYINRTGLLGYHIPRFVAIIISFGTLASFIALFVLLFVPLVSEQLQLLMSVDYEALLDKVFIPITKFEHWLMKHGFADKSEGFIMDEVKKNILSNDLITKLKIADVVNNVLAATSSFFVGLLAVLFITFFLLYEKGAIRQRLIAFIPNKYFEVAISAVHKVETLLANYLFGLLLQTFSVFTIISIGLIVADIKYAMTIGIFAALVHLIPYVGATVGSVFGLIVGLSTIPPDSAQDYFAVFIKIMTVFMVAILTDNILLQPLIFSRSVKAHPLEIFIVVFVGAALAGALGMVLAIPTYTIFRVSAIEFRKGYKQYQVFKH
ncbi:MAG: AI-2E family transporter [Cytophagales bacterium]|nr:MAG: AI-2E family transporter [Cytophagales bacterium]TAF59897.1 MAG: AI-2E family transporter [Cytophagales bacterium]